jgi:hypothetical protein
LGEPPTGGATVTSTAFDVAVPPALSVAFAVTL